MSVAAYLSCKQAAGLLGVSESTIKRLCDDSVLSSVRTPGGHRRISHTSVNEWLASTGNCSTRSLVSMREPSMFVAVDDVLRHLIEDRNHDLYHDVNRMRRRHTLAEICDRVFAPALGKLGCLWGEKSLGQYQLAVACQRMRGLLVRISSDLLSDEPMVYRAIGGTALNDKADLSSLFAELTLREIGWDAESLGADLPCEVLSQAARDREVQIAWMCYTHIDSAQSVQEYNRSLNALLPATTRLVIGGSMLSSDVRRELRYSFFGDSFQHLANYALGQFPKRQVG